MIELTDDIEINKPVDQVFDFVSNLENAPKWQNDVSEVTMEAGAGGSLGVGTRFNETVKIMGRPVHTVCEITQYEYPSRMAFKTTSSGLIQYDGLYLFKPEGAVTRLSFTGTMSMGGFWRLLQPLYTGEVKRGLVAEHKRLKGVVEAQGQS